MKTFCLFFCLAVCPAVMAETVMVSIGGEGLADQADPGYRVCFLALESGVMDVFFDAGKIVFNDSEFRGSQDERYRTVRVAREGGASMLLLVNCVYNSDGAKDLKTGDGVAVSLPEKILIEYVRVSDFGVVRKLEIAPSAREAASHPAIERYYIVLGRKAAQDILK